MTAVDQQTRAWPGGPVQLEPHGLPREQWLAVRRRGIGGSDVGAIFGLDPYNSPLSVYMDKRGELDDNDAGEAAGWGNLLEPVVADVWAGGHGAYAWQAGVLAHPDRTWQLANPDRLFVTAGAGQLADRMASGRPDGLLEVKTTSAWLTEDWDADTGRMPDRARLQIQHYLDVTGLREAHVACLVGGQRLVVFGESYDAELAEMIRNAAGRFWHEHVLAGNPPPVDGSRATRDLLGRLYEVAVDDVAVLDPDEVRPLLLARAEAKQLARDAAEAVDAVENALKDLLREHQVGVVDGRPVVTWKSQHRAAHTVAASTFRKLHVPKKALDALT